MAARTARPTRAARIAWRLAVLTAAAGGIWALATLATEPAHADPPPSVVEATLEDLGVLVGDLLPPEAAAAAAAAIEEAGQAVAVTAADAADPGHAPVPYTAGSGQPLEDPPAGDAPLLPAQPNPAPVKRPLVPPPTSGSARTPTATPTPTPTQTRAPAKRGDVDNHRAAKQVAPLQTFPDCGPNSTTTGSTPAAPAPPTGVDTDLTSGWRPPDLTSIRVSPSDTRGSGLTWRPNAPAG